DNNQGGDKEERTRGAHEGSEGRRTQHAQISAERTVRKDMRWVGRSAHGHGMRGTLLAHLAAHGVHGPPGDQFCSPQTAGFLKSLGRGLLFGVTASAAKASRRARSSFT